MSKLISNLLKGRGANAPALLAPPKTLLLVRLICVSGGYCALEWWPCRGERNGSLAADRGPARSALQDLSEGGEQCC